MTHDKNILEIAAALVDLATDIVNPINRAQVLEAAMFLTNLVHHELLSEIRRLRDHGESPHHCYRPDQDAL